MKSLHLKRAIHFCEKGCVIAYPTEAVYGLGCLPFEEQSITRILQLKNRSVSKGLILVASDISQLDSYIDFSKVIDLEEIHNSWPGPVTWLISAKPTIPSWLTGEHETLAVRVSSNPTIQALCEKLGPIVSTSANPYAAEPAKSSNEVRAYFPSLVDYVIPGNITNTMNPTEIRDAQTGNIIRLA